VPSSVKPRALCGKYFGFAFIFLHEQKLIQSAQDLHTKSFTIEQLACFRTQRFCQRPTTA
jgi:hypothetical protein